MLECIESGDSEGRASPPAIGVGGDYTVTGIGDAEDEALERERAVCDPGIVDWRSATRVLSPDMADLSRESHALAVSIMRLNYACI